MHTRPTTALILLIALSGCDINVHRKEYDDSHHYTPPPYGGYQEDRHTLLGSFDVRDRHTGAPIRGAEISVRVLREGRVQDRFILVTNHLGVATFERNATGPNHPFSHMEFAVKKDGYRLVHDSTHIRLVDTVRDTRGGLVRIHQASARVFLTPHN